MSGKNDFEDGLKIAAQSLLADDDRMRSLCDPSLVEDQSVVGSHLSQGEVSELHELILIQIADVAAAIERTLEPHYPEVSNRAALAEANEVLDAAISSGEVSVDAGLITQLTDRFHTLGVLMIGILHRMKESGPDSSYIFDLRLTTGDTDKTWLKDFEKLITAMGLVTKSTSTYARMYKLHGARDIYENYESREVAIRKQSDDDIPEFLVRAKLLFEDFNRLVKPLVPPRLSEELAVHYFEVLHMMNNNLVRAVLHFENEREEPGVAFASREKGSALIYTSYAERLSKFLDTFRATLIAINTIERTLLLMECRERRLDTTH